MLQFSIVINTDGRRDALRNTLENLYFLNYPEYEVCVVCGPTPDGTKELVKGYTGRIKTAACPVRNLSISRNIGVALAAGEIVAFIDDDGLAEPDWLSDLAPAFQDPLVAAAGGLVKDYTGVSVQYRYASADRLGNADWQRSAPADAFNFPLSHQVPYVQGTNGAFRRSALLDIGGFDEEIEFYLDETDVCARLIDQGFKIRQLSNAVVHHKFLSSELRTSERVIRNRYPIIKNKIYFSLVNNKGHHSMSEVVMDAQRFIAVHENDIRHHISGGRLLESDLEQYRRDVERAWRIGLSRGLSDERRLVTAQTLETHRSPFLPLTPALPVDERQRVVFLCQDYPPKSLGGIARYVHELATGSARLGHHTHVLTRGEGHDRIDFEEGVWVHRIIPKPHAEERLPDGTKVPAHIWDYSATMLDEARNLHRDRPVDVVVAPIWDCEGVAFVVDGEFPLVTSLQTTLAYWLDSKAELKQDPQFMTEFGLPMLTAEKLMFERSTGILAISHAIVRDLEDAYAVRFNPAGLSIIHPGMSDWAKLPAQAPAALPEGSLRLLFTGRLEPRKGIDILLQAARRVLARHPHVHLDLVGDDTIPLAQGKSTYRDEFCSDPAAEPFLDRVVFHGKVSEEHLRGFYQDCDIFIAPSRFESFGLILVEAMMYGKPAIGCRTGGMSEIICDGTTGLLAEPDNVDSLERAVELLVTDAQLRRRLGVAARADYEARFTADSAARRVAAYLGRFRHFPLRELEFNFAPEIVALERHTNAISLVPQGTASLECSRESVNLYFLTHPWSGYARILCNGEEIDQVDLYTQTPGSFVLVVPPQKSANHITVERMGIKNPLAHDSQVILIDVHLVAIASESAPSPRLSARNKQAG